MTTKEEFIADLDERFQSIKDRLDAGEMPAFVLVEVMPGGRLFRVWGADEDTAPKLLYGMELVKAEFVRLAEADEEEHAAAADAVCEDCETSPVKISDKAAN